MNGYTRNIARLCAAFALIVQSFLPAGLAVAADHGVSASSFICNITGVAPTDKAQAAVTELLRLAGKDVPPETPAETPPGHCDNCILLAAATLPYAAISLALPIYQPAPAHIYSTGPAFHALPHGPPLGGRAPPLFL